jgi:hypothetical protein
MVSSVYPYYYFGSHVKAHFYAALVFNFRSLTLLYVLACIFYVRNKVLVCNTNQSKTAR